MSSQAAIMESTNLSVSISRYKNGRHWAIWLNGELLAVALYKKGAISILKTIEALTQQQVMPHSEKKQPPFEEDAARGLTVVSVAQSCK